MPETRKNGADWWKGRTTSTTTTSRLYRNTPDAKRRKMTWVEQNGVEFRKRKLLKAKDAWGM